MGNVEQIVSETTGITQTPIVFGVKHQIALELGWTNGNVKVKEILAALESGAIRYMMSSATQSNSGAMAYLGYLYAIAGHPDILTSDHLDSPSVIEPAQKILSEIESSAGSSGTLTNDFLDFYAFYDGMVNYESEMIAANRELVDAGREPLFVIYPVDGLAIADWPLGFVDSGDPEIREIYDKLARYLHSPEVQQHFLEVGRRPSTDVLGLDAAQSDQVNVATGVDLSTPIAPFTMPSTDVLHKALVLYQTELRKPSFTVICLDYSSAMLDGGAEQLKDAMRILAEPDVAARYYLQPSVGDVTIVMPFNEQVIDQWRANGNSPEQFRALLTQIEGLEPSGDADYYEVIIAGLNSMDFPPDSYAASIILLTDGSSEPGNFVEFLRRYDGAPVSDVPVHVILVGDGTGDQMEAITEISNGRLFDGRTELLEAFREVRGHS